MYRPRTGPCIDVIFLSILSLFVGGNPGCSWNGKRHARDQRYRVRPADVFVPVQIACEFRLITHSTTQLGSRDLLSPIMAMHALLLYHPISSTFRRRVGAPYATFTWVRNLARPSASTEVEEGTIGVGGRGSRNSPQFRMSLTPWPSSSANLSCMVGVDVSVTWGGTDVSPVPFRR